MAKLLEAVKLHESFKLSIWDHRLPLFLLIAVCLITFLPQKCPPLPILSCCNQQTNCSQKLLSERSYLFPFGLQYFWIDFSQGDMPINKCKMKEGMQALALLYIQWHQTWISPARVCFLQMHLMGYIHQQQSISWTCSSASWWSFCLQSFDMSNGSFFFAMIIQWRCLRPQLPRHPTIRIIIIIGYVWYYGLILRLWWSWSFPTLPGRCSDSC